MPSTPPAPLSAALFGVADIRIDGLSRRFADRRVLTDVSFTVPRDARVGLIGENGSGKSTLLRIIAGADQPDSGVVSAPARLGLLQQELSFTSTDTVGTIVDEALAEFAAAAYEVEQAGQAVAQGDPGAAERLDLALREAERTDAWTSSSRRGEVVDGLGLGNLDEQTRVGRLSGGQRSRLAVAALLLARPTALVLDEPTNHLDDDAVDFLARTLRSWPGPVLFASHDRAFLDDVATRVVDLDPSPLPYAVVAGTEEGAGSGYGVQVSRGGYSDHLQVRRAARARWLRQYEEEQQAITELRHDVAVTARTTNAKDTSRSEVRGAKKFYADRDAKVTSRRVRNAAGRLETLEQRQLRRPSAELNFAGLRPRASAAGDGPLLVVDEVSVTGRLAATSLALSSAEKLLVTGRLAATSLALSSAEKLLVTGRNGSGKSTLLQVLRGTLAPTAGTVRTSGRTALLAQDVTFPDPVRTPRELYAQAVGSARAEAHPLRSLGLVAGRDLDRPVGRLSVGQQRRLALALVIADPPPVLLLDEPTNHLSLALAEELEHALARYAGAVVLASHDRWLRRRWEAGVLDLDAQAGAPAAVAAATSTSRPVFTS